MKKRKFFFPLAVALAFAHPLFAAESHDMGGHTMSGHDMSGHQMETKEQDRIGEKVHESTVESYKLAYHLSNNRERLEAAKKAGKAKDLDPSKVKSNHLMIYITAANGSMVTDAKVGFLVKGPDGAEQTVMTMLMGSGFGGDIELKTPGNYTIKSKSTVGGKNLLDEFTYTKQ